MPAAKGMGGKFIGQYNVSDARECLSPCVHGTCSAGVCMCEAGYYGAACDVRRCHGRSLLVEDSGSFRPNGNMVAFSKLQPKSEFCWWLIQPASLAGNREGSIHIQLQFGGVPNDLAPDVVVFDGPTMLDTVLINTPVRHDAACVCTCATWPQCSRAEAATMLWAACQLMHSCGLVVCVIQATANPNEIDNDIFYAPRPPVTATSTGNSLLVVWRNRAATPNPQPSFVAEYTAAPLAPPFLPPTADPSSTDCLACVGGGYLWCAAHRINGYRGFCSGVLAADVDPDVTSLDACGGEGVTVLRDMCHIQQTDTYAWSKGVPIAGPVSCEACAGDPRFGICRVTLAIPSIADATVSVSTCMLGSQRGPAGNASPAPGGLSKCAANGWQYNGTVFDDTCLRTSSLPVFGSCDVAYECLHGGQCDAPTGLCICAPGYAGSQCEYEWPASNDDGSGCNGGVATDNGQCVCPMDMGGPTCELPVHPTGRGFGGGCADRASCSNHGVCATATGACACDAGWAGQWCEFKLAPGRPRVSCDNGGVYDAAQNRCVCPYGSTGTACNIEYALQFAMRGNNCDTDADCGGHGNCTALSGWCSCDDGWAGLRCEFPAVYPHGHRPTPGACLAGEGKYEYGTEQCVCTMESATGGLCNVLLGSGTGYNYVDASAGCLPGECYNGGVCDVFSGVCHCAPGFGGQSCEYAALYVTPAPKPMPNASASSTSTGALDTVGQATDPNGFHPVPSQCVSGSYEAATGVCMCPHHATGVLCDFSTYYHEWQHLPRIGVQCTADSDCGRGFCNVRNGLCVCPQGYRGLRCEYPFTLLADPAAHDGQRNAATPNDVAPSELYMLSRLNCSRFGIYEYVVGVVVGVARANRLTQRFPRGWRLTPGMARPSVCAAAAGLARLATSIRPWWISGVLLTPIAVELAATPTSLLETCACPMVLANARRASAVARASMFCMVAAWLSQPLPPGRPIAAGTGSWVPVNASAARTRRASSAARQWHHWHQRPCRATLRRRRRHHLSRRRLEAIHSWWCSQPSAARSSLPWWPQHWLHTLGTGPRTGVGAPVVAGMLCMSP